MTRGKKKLVCVDKANVLRILEIMARDRSKAMEKDYPWKWLVSYEFVDAWPCVCYNGQIRTTVMITEELFGDIFTDEAS